MTSDTDFPHDISAAREAYLKAQRKDRKRKADRDRAAGKRQAKPTPAGSKVRAKVSPPAVYIARDWPTDHKARWVNALCVHPTEGGSLRGFVRQYPQGPSLTCWYEWFATDATISELYTRARENGADTLAEETIGIADEVKDAGHMDSARVNAARLRVDARKWVASKLKPKVYADRIETVTSGNLTVTHTISDEDRAKALASIMAREAIKTAPNLQAAQRAIAGPVIELKAEKTGLD
jgi:hypothetical protein